MEKSEKRKQQLREAQKNYKKIGTNLRIRQAEQVEEICKTRNLTVSQYIKDLIESDLKALSGQNSLEAIPNLIKENKRLTEALNKQESIKTEYLIEIKALNDEIKSLKSAQTLTQRLINAFKG